MPEIGVDKKSNFLYPIYFCSDPIHLRSILLKNSIHFIRFGFQSDLHFICFMDWISILYIQIVIYFTDRPLPTKADNRTNDPFEASTFSKNYGRHRGFLTLTD